MAPKLKASESGRARIQQARNESGRTIDDEQWLLEASRLLEPEKHWQLGGPYASGCSESTWKRFLHGTPISTAAFKAFCQVLGLNWEEVGDRREIEPQHPADLRPGSQLTATRRVDWDSAPDVSFFYGRTDELTTLEQWIVQDKCRLVALLGMGGIGKTALSVKLAQQIAGSFEYVIWRSLAAAPTYEQTLADLLGFFSNQPKTQPDLSRFLEYFRSHRCLVVLDGVETLLGTGQLAGKYRSGYQEYSNLFKQVGDTQHQSCLILTSSEKSREIALSEGLTRPVRSSTLTGLSQSAAQEILREKGLVENRHWVSLIQLYRGNPLALKIVATTILEVFNGQVDEFLSKETLFIGQIEPVLEQQLSRLSDLETEVMCQLAAAHQPVSIDGLRSGISSAVATSKLMSALESLGWRSLIEKTPSGGASLFTLQPVVRKYVINCFAPTE